MKKIVFFVAVLAGFFAPKCKAQAADVYITPSGNPNGVCTSNPADAAWFNNSANWGTGNGQIGPGTTVHLCGTFTGGLGATVLSIQGNGSSGNPITILWEAGARVSSPACAGNDSGSGCINTHKHSNITFNGDATGGRQGIIENTANGTLLANRRRSTAIQATGSTNLVVKNLTIRNLYVHTSVSDSTLGSAGDVLGVTALGADNALIANNTIDFAGWALNMGSNNYEVKFNTLSNMDHGLADGSHGGPTSGQKIHDNVFGDMAAWDTTCNCYHHDGVHFFSENGVHTGPKIYNNTFSGNMGANTTAWIFMEGSAGFGQGIHDDLIFNNTFLNTGAFGKQAIWIEGNGQSSGTGVYNNFVYVGNTRSDGTACLYRNVSNFKAKNNICIGGFSNVQGDGVSQAAGGINNNVYADLSADFGKDDGFKWNTGFQRSVSGWRSLCACDANAIMVTTSHINANLSTGVIASSSIAVGVGANLSSLGIPELNLDKNRIPRPSSGAWPAGAFTPTPLTTRPDPPTGMAVTVN